MAKQNSKKLREQRKKAGDKAAYVGTATALILIGLVGFIIWFVRYSPNLTVYQVGEHEVKKDVYTCTYYYETLTSQEWESYGFDSSQSPYEQKFSYTAAGTDRFKTWGEYFESLTNDSLKLKLVMQDTAAKGGYTYTQEVQDNIDNELEALLKDKKTAVSFSDYMLGTYGAPIKEKTLKEYLTMHYQSARFYKDITENKALFNKYIGGTAADFESTYQSHRDEIDVVSFRYYSLIDNAENAEKIEALKHAKSQKEFQKLCNEYENDETYTKEDQSLYKDVALKTISTLKTNVISQQLSSLKSKAGDIYYSDFQKDDQTVAEIVYVVKARGKNMNAYNKSEVKQWEFGAMGIMLEDYTKANYKIEVSEKGIKAFRDDIIVPQ